MPLKNGKWRPLTRYSPEFPLVMKKKKKKAAALKKPQGHDQAADPRQGELAWINPVPSATHNQSTRRQESIRVMSRQMFGGNVG